MTRRPPIGSQWRTLVHKHRTGRDVSTGAVHTLSADFRTPRDEPPRDDVVMAGAERTIFDELVVVGVLHVEQMGRNSWWIGIPTRDGGLIHVDIDVDPRKRAARSVMIRDDRADTTTRLIVDSRLDVEGAR